MMPGGKASRVIGRRFIACTHSLLIARWPTRADRQASRPVGKGSVGAISLLRRTAPKDNCERVQ